MDATSTATAITMDASPSVAAKNPSSGASKLPEKLESACLAYVSDPTQSTADALTKQVRDVRKTMENMPTFTAVLQGMAELGVWITTDTVLHSGKLKTEALTPFTSILSTATGGCNFDKCVIFAGNNCMRGLWKAYMDSKNDEANYKILTAISNSIGDGFFGTHELCMRDALATRGLSKIITMLSEKTPGSCVDRYVAVLSKLCLNDANHTALLSLPVLEALAAVSHEMFRAKMGLACLCGQIENSPYAVADQANTTEITNALRCAIDGTRMKAKGSSLSYTLEPWTTACVIARLSSTNANKPLLRQSGALDILMDMVLKTMKNPDDPLLSPVDTTLHWGLSAIWNLSFLTENRDLVLKNEEFMTTVKRISQREMAVEGGAENPPRTAQGLLSTLQGMDRKVEGTRPLSASVSTSKTIMLSYNWGAQTLVLQVRDFLRSQGLQVWMDVDNMTGNIMEAMASAVETADLVLVFIAGAYKASANCRLEADYIMVLKKPWIPIMVQPNYRPDGWLGLAMGNKLYVDFTDPSAGGVGQSLKFLQQQLAMSMQLKQSRVTVAPSLSAPATASAAPTPAATAAPATSSLSPKTSSAHVPDTAAWTSWSPKKVLEWLNPVSEQDPALVEKMGAHNVDGFALAEMFLLSETNSKLFHDMVKDEMGLGLISRLRLLGLMRQS